MVKGAWILAIGAALLAGATDARGDEPIRFEFDAAQPAEARPGTSAHEDDGSRFERDTR